MSFPAILGALIIGPLKLIFEFIFDYAYMFTGHAGLAVIFLSLIMNILVLPLYMRADAMQEAARDTEAKLHRGVQHIKKTFSGDEQMMMLQTYYRQNNYRPADALRGSVSLLLEIPFFIAAYQFLSHLIVFNGVSLGPIADLSVPDGLISIGGHSINLLPFVMTGINFISSALFLKGYPLKSKIQLYAMALFFLVFLYSSPACLVFYWTLNNLFSLVKTVFYKLKHPGRVLSALSALAGLGLLVFGLFVYETDSAKRRLFFAGLGLLLLLPPLFPLIKKRLGARALRPAPRPDRKFFLLGTVFMTALVGLLIPSAFIADSPQEYVDLLYFSHPLWHIVNSLCVAAGTFLIWLRVFYWLSSDRGKVVFEKLVWIMCPLMLVNYMFFGTNLGTISPTLVYDWGFEFTARQYIVNLLVLAALGAALYLVAVRWKKAAASLLAVSAVALCCMSVRNMYVIQSSVAEISAPENGGTPHFRLSTTGKNVIVLMLDRGMGVYAPYIFNEKPELKEQFSGFTYYENTVSHGGYTNFGVPGVMGGYEYTPVEMNKRSSEPLREKHNEALKVMPALFSENGYEVTVIDPSYANYMHIPDLSIYDDLPGVNAYLADGRFSPISMKETVINNTRRNFFCFSLMKSLPLFMQTSVYNNGRYHQSDNGSDNSLMSSSQAVESLSVAKGVYAAFMDSYYVMNSLSDITQITGEETDTLLVMCNDMTHDTMLLQEPDYMPAPTVDNRAYDAENAGRFTLNGRTISVDSTEGMAHYQSDMSAMLLLGRWFDYLRANGVYDNTRIIIVADHGRQLSASEELIVDGIDMTFFYPLLMVKDFDSEGFATSDEFMTNADVPTLATAGIIEDPVNPYTGKAINNDEKYAHEQFIIMSANWTVTENNGNTFLPASWISVKDDIWNRDNWTVYDKVTVLDEYAAP